MDQTPLHPHEIFRYKKAHPLVLDLLLTKAFNMEWWDWEPETLRSEITREFRGGPSELSWAKIQATKTVHLSPGLIFDHWEAFLPTLLSLNNEVPDFDVLQVPTVAQLYAGVDMLKTLDPVEEFSEEVKRFMASCFFFGGVYYAPNTLSFLQEYLRRPYYRCDDCGNVEYIDEDHDGVCDDCGRDWYKSAAGTTITRARVAKRYTYDDAPIRRRFTRALAEPEHFVPNDNITEDVQTSKLLMAIQYRDFRRKQMEEQVKWIGIT